MTRVVVLTPNPAIDVTYRVDRQRIGETVRVREVTRRAGGKGVNVARVLGQLGVQTTSLLALGGTAGRWIADQLGADGLVLQRVRLAGESRTTVTVVDGLSQPTTLSEPGPTVSAAEWAQLEAALGACLGEASLLVVAGSLPPGTDPAVVGTWVRRAERAGVPTVVDASGPALLAAAAAGATLVKPNRAELLAATGEQTEAVAAEALLRPGSASRHASVARRGCGTVVVSRGEQGIAAYTDHGMLEVPAVPGVHGNPTGAGDAATAGLVAALLDDEPLDQVLRRAAAAGAAAVLRPIAGEIDLEAWHRFRPGSGGARP